MSRSKRPPVARVARGKAVEQALAQLARSIQHLPSFIAAVGSWIEGLLAAGGTADAEGA